MMNRIFLLLLTCTFFISSYTNAQNKKVTYGKVRIENLKAKTCPIEPNAHAEILYQYGFASLHATPEGIKLETTTHIRIKLYDKEGFKYSKINIPQYQARHEREYISQLKANMYYLKNGEIIKTRIASKNVEKVDLNPNMRVTRFSFNNLKKGCIIEYKFKKISDFVYSINTWNFQTDIPVRYNRFEVRVPETVLLNREIIGYEEIALSEKSCSYNGPGALDNMRDPGFFSPVKANDLDNMRSTGYDEVKATDYMFTAENIKSFKNQKYLYCPKDHISRMEFSLEGKNIHFATKKPKDSLSSIYNKLISAPEFGNALNRRAIMNRILPDVLKDCKSEKEKIERIYYYVKNNIDWDGKYSLLKKHSLSYIHRKKSGNSGEINLFLTTMLRTAGIKCCPIIVSTRDNGKVKTNNAKVSKYNHCICMVTQDYDTTLLDATNPFLPMNIIPFNVLGCEGIAITPQGPEKLQIKSNKLSCKNIVINASLNSNGQLVGNISKRYNNYLAYNFRINSTKKEERINHIQGNIPDFNIKDYNTKNLLNPHIDAEESYKFTLGKETESTDLISIKNLMSIVNLKPAFNLKDRKLPIDYPYPELANVVIKINLPKGYKLESLPENISKEMKDKSYAYAFTYSTADNKVMIHFRKMTFTTSFMPSQFKELEEIQESYIEKCSENIILRKES